MAALPSPGQGFVRPGLDPSWQDAIRAALEQRAVFGRDVVFTHGPLAFLDKRLPPAGLGWSLVTADVVLVVLAGGLGWRLHAARGGLLLQLLLAAALASASPW